MIKILFNKYYKLANIISSILILISVLFLMLKGLNYGVDFKGGTLIEIRNNNPNITIKEIRENFNSMNLKGVTVKQFGNNKDYIVKFQNL